VALARNPFARARDDHRNEVAEDYVELVYRLLQAKDEVRTTDLVEALGVSQPTVTQTLDRLSRDGLVLVHPRRRVELTKEGEALAKALLERHVLIVRFLEAVGVPSAVAELDAEGIEHHVSQTTQRAIARFMRTQEGAQ
jgi:DtxR family manganese transport transcriptional regulator